MGTLADLRKRGEWSSEIEVLKVLLAMRPRDRWLLPLDEMLAEANDELQKLDGPARLSAESRIEILRLGTDLYPPAAVLEAWVQDCAGIVHPRPEAERLHSLRGGTQGRRARRRP